MRHIPIDTKRFEDAKAATLCRSITDKVPSSQSDSSLGSCTVEIHQHSQDELESASGLDSKSSTSGAILSSSLTQDRDESGTGSIATRGEERHGTNSNNRPPIDIQRLIRSAQVRNMGGTR